MLKLFKKKEKPIIEEKVVLPPLEIVINNCKEKEKRLLIVMGNTLISVKHPNYHNWLIEAVEKNINIVRVIEKEEVICVYGRKKVKNLNP